LDTYEKFYKLYISSYLGKMLISKITPLDIRRWQSWLSEKELKNNYSSSIQQFMRSLLNFAVKYDYLEKNPFKTSFVKNNLEKKTEIVVWSTEQFKKFIDYVDDDVYRAFFLTLYLCGLRVGEAQALTVGDVSFISSTISVNKTYDRTNHVVTSPKTANSVRTVYMVSELRETLKRLVEAHSRHYGFSDDSILFGFDKHLSSTTIKRY
jgi:integrase